MPREVADCYFPRHHILLDGGAVVVESIGSLNGGSVLIFAGKLKYSVFHPCLTMEGAYLFNPDLVFTIRVALCFHSQYLLVKVQEAYSVRLFRQWHIGIITVRDRQTFEL